MNRGPLFVVLIVLINFCQEFSCRNVHSKRGEENKPILSRQKLSEIRVYDRMKCFPKVMCTLTKTGAFEKLGTVSLNDLADGYLKLLTAFPGGPPSNLKPEDLSFREEDDFTPSESFPSKRRKQPGSGGEEGESEELLLSDPLLHYKEKLEMKKLMEELKNEEKAEASKKDSSWARDALSIPIKIGSGLLSKVVLPYLIGGDEGRRKKRGMAADIMNPVSSAMERWSKLKDAKQCGRIYPNCPFEAWEVVSMIKLIKDSQKKYEKRN